MKRYAAVISNDVLLELLGINTPGAAINGVTYSPETMTTTIFIVGYGKECLPGEIPPSSPVLKIPPMDQRT